MFTSDVSARGMDYPDVTAVLQVCIHMRVCDSLSLSGLYYLLGWVGRTLHDARRLDYDTLQTAVHVHSLLCTARFSTRLL